jgi:small GTP-binding protein
MGAWVFSTFATMGPEPLLLYPPPVEEWDKKQYHVRITRKNYIQVAIKSVSLLLGDESFEINDESRLKDIHVFGLLPYPDIESVALTNFTYYTDPSRKRMIPVSFSFLVHESKRRFLYNNYTLLKEIIKEFTTQILNKAAQNNIVLEHEQKKLTELLSAEIEAFLHKINNVRINPLNPISQQRKIKILFTGLENSGKTSFLYALDRKYSEIVRSTPTTRLKSEPVVLMGTSIIKWDLPGQKLLRENILRKAEMYLYETDVIYYFHDGTNSDLDESKDFLVQITNYLKQFELKIPIIIVISKIDEDIVQKPEIQKNIKKIKSEFIPLLKNYPYEFFETSIFSLYSILNAFSFGIQQLSPNRLVMEHILREFMEENHQILGLLLNQDGLNIAFVEKPTSNYTQILSYNQIFEFTAPNFTSIAKQFHYYQPKETNITEYRFSPNDLVILYRFQLEENIFFFLFYSKEPVFREKLIKNLPKIEEKMQHLLKYYIA